MRVASISENKDLEKRIAITPDILKKYISLGFEIFVLAVLFETLFLWVF